ncbi:hypothetical protein [Zunongwangia sp.]|uniref:hypothetical protein n=1 Tax=Zunongwangia sp. TaxID=1965325 RepID=UPI003AA9255F
MRINNTDSIKIIPPIYIVLIAVFITNFFLNLSFIGSEDPIRFSFFLPNIITFVVGVYFYRIGVSFEFDGEGEVLAFKNNGVFISNFFKYRLKKIEFPRRKLAKYSVTNFFIYATITLYIKSRRKGGLKKVTLNITLLNRKKKRQLITALKHSLEQSKAAA